MEPLNPVSLEREITKALNSVSGSIKKVSDAYDAHKTTELEFKKAYAIAYRNADGPVEDRKQQAVADTFEQAEAAKDAEVYYKYLLDHQRAYRDKLSAFQTLAKSVVAAYNVAGRNM